MLNKLPVEKILKTALKNGGEYADIFAEDTQQTTVGAENREIEKAVTGRDVGIGIRVLHDGNTAYGYTNDLSTESIMELADNVSSAVEQNDQQKVISLTKRKPDFVQKIKIDPKDISQKEKVELVKKSDSIAWDFNNKIQQVSVIYKDATRITNLANSLGEFIEEERIDTAFMVIVVASDGQIIQTGYEPIGGLSGLELLQNGIFEDVTLSACKRSILMLNSAPAPSGTMPVVLSSEAGGTMVHEAVGHGLEADLCLGGFSVYNKSLNKKVASPLITIIDDSTIAGKRGSFAFDDEGVKSQKTTLIDRGMLVSLMHNRETAKKMDLLSTGNGRRESYRYRPIVRMTNTIIEPGNDDPETIIKNTPKGLFVKKMGGGQVNTITGDFVFEVQEGYLIENGNIDRPVRGATLCGNGPDVLKKIDLIGNDLGYGIGVCGKDGQGVPVADAQPTLRISELVVGGTEHSDK